MIPTIVARKMESSCHAFWVTPAGTGISQRMIPVAIEAINGAIAAPAVGVFGGSGFAGTDTGEAAAEALMVSPFLGVLVSLSGEKLVENAGLWREKERCTAVDLWRLWRFNGGDCLGSDRRLRWRGAVRGRDAIETMAFWRSL